ncbi:MAG: ABC transporter permease, partial [Fidelibacterota bacterium]
VWYNPNLKSTYFMIPGIVAVLLTMITSLITSMGIVREREIGTLEQLMVTPIRSYQLIAGKTIPFAILGLVEITFALAVGTLWFQIPLLGNIGILFLFCFVFLLTTLGLGLFVSTAATTQQQAMFIAWFINVFALIMSGFLFPLENMPKMLQYISYLNPLRYFITVLRELFLKGSGINYLYKEGIIMLLFGLVIFTLSALRFRKRIS